MFDVTGNDFGIQPTDQLRSNKVQNKKEPA